MEYFPLLYNCLLFRQVTKEELPLLLSCLQPRKANFAKDATLILEGDTVKEVGIILAGSLQIVRNDFWGNKSLVSRFSAGDLFGETLACSGEPSQIRAMAETDLQVLFLDVKKILASCSKNCVFHTKLIENMVTILAEKNQVLMRKIAHITKRSTREKLLSYLSEESIKANSQSFIIPFDRQQLADYLCVERSAMSNELSKMRSERLLDYHKNAFTLKGIENNE